jgi:hypothetical protein
VQTWETARAEASGGTCRRQQRDLSVSKAFKEVDKAPPRRLEVGAGEIGHYGHCGACNVTAVGSQVEARPQHQKRKFGMAIIKPCSCFASLAVSCGRECFWLKDGVKACNLTVGQDKFKTRQKLAQRSDRLQILGTCFN